MYKAEHCGCEHHGSHHGEQPGDSLEGHSGYCGCGGHVPHEMHRTPHHHSGYSCGCHRHKSAGFQHHFVPREETITGLEEYLKRLQVEAKGIEERITALKTKGESV